jgi:hypothetical protein
MGHNIFRQIDKIFDDHPDSTPAWAEEILQELRAIRGLLEQTRQPQPTLDNPPKVTNDYYQFVQNLRKEMAANPDKNNYPEIVYAGRRIGVSFKGLLYYKETQQTLTTQEAFKVYRYLYDSKV